VESVCDDPQIIEQNIIVSYYQTLLSTKILKYGKKLKYFSKKKKSHHVCKFLNTSNESVPNTIYSLISFEWIIKMLKVSFMNIRTERFIRALNVFLLADLGNTG
jgi:hypothetical protein